MTARNPVQIRVASIDDAEPLASLASTTFVDTFGSLYPADDLRSYLVEAYAPPVFRALLANPAYRFWIAHSGDAWVGYAQAGPCTLPHPEARASQGELMRLYVVRSHQGTGISHSLMTATVAWMQRTFTGPLWLGVYSGNPRAQRFYAKYEFRKVGEYAYPVGKTRDREFIYRRD